MKAHVFALDRQSAASERPTLGGSNEAQYGVPAVQSRDGEIVRIEPTLREKGLILYECPECVYVTSVLLEPRMPKGSRS